MDVNQRMKDRVASVKFTSCRTCGSTSAPVGETTVYQMEQFRWVRNPKEDIKALAFVVLTCQNCFDTQLVAVTDLLDGTPTT